MTGTTARGQRRQRQPVRRRWRRYARRAGRNDNLFGQAGRDSLYGDAGDDFALGGTEDDFISGASADRLNGEDGNDKSSAVTTTI
jgi:Ca2+-binding RTX toxin-like protein